MNILRNIYEDTTARLFSYKKSTKLPFKKGVKARRHNLFNAIHCILRSIQALIVGKLRSENQRRISQQPSVADGIALFTSNGDELQQMIEDLNRENERVVLKINTYKTKEMFNSLAREQEFTIASQPLESVKEYVCLRQLLTGNPDHDKEIYRRIKLV